MYLIKEQCLQQWHAYKEGEWQKQTKVSTLQGERRDYYLGKTRGGNKGTSEPQKSLVSKHSPGDIINLLEVHISFSRFGISANTSCSLFLASPEYKLKVKMKNNSPQHIPLKALVFLPRICPLLNIYYFSTYFCPDIFMHLSAVCYLNTGHSKYPPENCFK